MKAIGVASRRVVLAALCSHAILPARPSAAALGASAAALGAPRCALGALALPASPAPVPRAASVSCHPQPEPEPRPHPPHRAWNPPAPEYTNSVTASRDTNISPREAYDTIRERASPRSKAEVELGRVLDLGAGAGASTKLLSDIGWREVVAVDPSNLAWERYSAGSALPGGVSFVHASDEQYVNRWRREAPLRKFDAVVINYAINPGKAAAFARELLLRARHRAAGQHRLEARARLRRPHPAAAPTPALGAGPLGTAGRLLDQVRARTRRWVRPRKWPGPERARRRL